MSSTLQGRDVSNAMTYGWEFPVGKDGIRMQIVALRKTASSPIMAILSAVPKINGEENWISTPMAADWTVDGSWESFRATVENLWVEVMLESDL